MQIHELREKISPYSRFTQIKQCPFTLHEKSIEDPLKFGKNRPDTCRISQTFFSHVSLNSSEYFGIRCVRIPARMFGVFISAGDQVAIAQYYSPNSESFREIFGFLPPKSMQHFENPLWKRIRGSQVCQPQDMLPRSFANVTTGLLWLSTRAVCASQDWIFLVLNKQTKESQVMRDTWFSQFSQLFIFAGPREAATLMWRVTSGLRLTRARHVYNRDAENCN